MRGLPLAVSLAAAIPSCGLGQTPDVRIRTDLRMHYRSERDGENTLRWYDPMGRYSLVSIDFGLEPGFRAYIAERLQRIPDNADNEQLDEYYVEDPGLWRVGKQYMPFGKHRLLRESARGARGDTNLIVESIPIAFAVCDNGPGRARGVYARVGGRLGVSGAFGSHIGAQSTSLAAVRRPENANGFGRGYKAVVGMDYSRKFGNLSVDVEAAVLRSGMTNADRDRDVSELAFGYQAGKKAWLGLAWSRDWKDNINVYRGEARFEPYPNVFLEPMLRLKNTRLFDAGVSLRVKL